MNRHVSQALLNGRSSPKAYMALLIAQTATATTLFILTYPIFHDIVLNLGRPQDVNIWTEVAIIGAAVFLQCCYWVRYLWVPIFAPTHSVLLGHFLQFLSRASFFFGGALFSTVFFRHVPELEVLPPVGQGVVKAIALLLMLFSLFCYSLELERLGRVTEGPAPPTLP